MSGLERTVQLDEGELRLKIATKRTVKAVHGTQLAGEIAGLPGRPVRQQRISDAQCVNTREFLRIDEVVRLEEAARGSGDWPAITRAQARHHGFALLPLPDCSMLTGTSDFHKAIADVSREAGEVVSRLCLALADGEISAAEIREGNVHDEIQQAINSLATLDALCSAVERSGKPATVTRLREQSR